MRMEIKFSSSLWRTSIIFFAFKYHLCSVLKDKGNTLTYPSETYFCPSLVVETAFCVRLEFELVQYIVAITGPPE